MSIKRMKFRSILGAFGFVMVTSIAANALAYSCWYSSKAQGGITYKTVSTHAGAWKHFRDDATLPSKVTFGQAWRAFEITYTSATPSKEGFYHCSGPEMTNIELKYGSTMMSTGSGSSTSTGVAPKKLCEGLTQKQITKLNKATNPNPHSINKRKELSKFWLNVIVDVECLGRTDLPTAR